VYDQLDPLVAAVVVANPARVARMKEPGVKTDAADALFLARLSASGMLPVVWVPGRWASRRSGAASQGGERGRRSRRR